jgi:hypothetical protein
MNEQAYEQAKKQMDELIEKHKHGQLTESERRRLSDLQAKLWKESGRRLRRAERELSRDPRVGRSGCSLVATLLTLVVVAILISL